MNGAERFCVPAAVRKAQPSRNNGQSGAQAPSLPCPHCLQRVPDLAAHLRDDGGAGTRCAKLQRDARIGHPIDLTTMEEL